MLNVKHKNEPAVRYVTAGFVSVFLSTRRLGQKIVCFNKSLKILITSLFVKISLRELFFENLLF